jgi:hypothetical protein
MKTKLKIFFCVVFLVTSFSGSCQVWELVFDSVGSTGRQVILTDDSCYLVTGFCSAFDGGLTLKLDLAGNIIWMAPNGAGSVVQTYDHKFVLAGGHYPYATLEKMNKDGSIKWAKTYGGGLQEGFHGVIQSSDSGLVLCGYTQNHGDSTFLVTKTDSIGNIIWTTCFPSMDRRSFDDLIEFDHHYYVVGQESDESNIPSYLFIVKMTERGTPRWQKKFESYCKGYAIDITADSSLIVAGGSVLAKLTTEGDTLWTKALKPGLVIQAIDVTPSGGYIVSGYDRLYIPVNILSELDPMGEKIWMHTYPTFSDWDQGNFYSVKCTNDGGFITAGYNSYYRDEMRLRVLKTDENGGIIVNVGSDSEPPHSHIYPNPNDGRFIIDTEGINKIEIYNAVGKVVYLTGNKDEIDLSGYESGIYLVRITTERAMFTEKLIKR